jgi:hypothetical protein
MPKVKSALKLRKLLLDHGTGKSKIQEFVDPIFEKDRETGKAVDCAAVLVVRALEAAPRERVTLTTVEKAKELMETGDWQPQSVKLIADDPFHFDDEDEEDKTIGPVVKAKKGKGKKAESDVEDEAPAE